MIPNSKFNMNLIIDWLIYETEFPCCFRVILIYCHLELLCNEQIVYENS